MDTRKVVVCSAVLLALSFAFLAGERPAKVLYIPYLTDATASAVLSAAERLVWDHQTGAALAEVPEGRLAELAGLQPIRLDERANDLDFAEALRAWMPEYDGGAPPGRFAVMTPMVLERRGTRPSPAGLTSTPPRAESTCISQGFDATKIWRESGGSWLHYEGGHSNNSGDYYWKESSCDASGGTRSADAVRGGSMGGSLSCSSYYVAGTESWLEYDPDITCAYGAMSASLAFVMKVQMEYGYDFFFCGVSTDGGDHYSGYGYTGTYTSSWYSVQKDLRSWYSLGDLTTRSSFILAMVFVSDSSINSGFGTRLDSILLSTAPPPRVTTMTKQTGPFRFVAKGSGFQSGVRVYIDGTEWPTVQYKSETKVILGGGASLKAAVPRGVAKTFRFVNPDGGSSTYVFSW